MITNITALLLYIIVLLYIYKRHILLYKRITNSNIYIKFIWVFFICIICYLISLYLIS